MAKGWDSDGRVRGHHGPRYGLPTGRIVFNGRPYRAGRADAPDPPQPGWVVFSRWSADETAFKPLYVRTTGEPTVPVADSGWEIVERPNRVDLTVWRSGKPLEQDVPLSMDVLADPAADVQGEWDVLMALWRPGGGVRPVVLSVDGPIGRRDLPWVITDLDVDQDSVIRRGSALARVEAVVTLTQYVRADLAAYADPDDAKTQATDERPNFTLSRAGDTLRKIAKRDPPDGLGKGEKWVQLRKLNPAYKTANQPIPTGTRIRIPNG